MDTSYHRGERAVQERAGLAEQAGFSLGGIRGSVPEVAAAFLAEQPMIIVGAADRGGRMWASLLTGEPGFLRTPDPLTLTVDALPVPEDPLAEVLAGPARIGMIAVEPATRRRMRLNGRSVPQGGGLRIDLDQVIANCPKYLQKRAYHTLTGEDAPRTVHRSSALSTAQRLGVSAADTFFVATASDRGDADASHRGGNPGFVQVLSPTELRWPDYVGNAMFLTLGNLELNPAAGLVFPDWETGSVLLLSGTARTDWDAGTAVRIPGAQRLVDFRISEVREISGVLPLRWSRPTYSRFNPPVP